MRLQIIHFADGRSHDVDIPASSVAPNSGAVVFRELVSTVLRDVGCASVHECFALASPRQPSSDTNDEGLALFANFKDLQLPNANITVAAHPDGRRVLLTADAVALYVMVHSPVAGRWDRNGVLLLPHQPCTLTFTPDDETGDRHGSFGSRLHVDAVNIARTVFKSDDSRRLRRDGVRVTLPAAGVLEAEFAARAAARSRSRVRQDRVRWGTACSLEDASALGGGPQA